MLTNILAITADFIGGYLWFWIAPLALKSKTQLGPVFIGHKYLGFESYSDLRSHVLGANALWGPIVGVLCVFLLAEFGVRHAAWALAVPAGCALSFFRFLRKPKSAWDNEDLPIWRA